MINDLFPEYLLPNPKTQPGLATVTTVTSLSLVWTCLFVRIWLRWKSRSRRSDDYLLAAATVLMDTIHSILVFPFVAEGRQAKNGAMSAILYIAILALSKHAILLPRLQPSFSRATASKLALSTPTMWAVLSFILLALPCSCAPKTPLIPGVELCNSCHTRWQAITAGDMMTELILVMVSISGTKVSKTRQTVLLLLSRLPIIAASLASLYYLSIDKSSFALFTTSTSSTSPVYTARYIIATQSHLTLAILSNLFIDIFLRAEAPSSQSPSIRWNRNFELRNAGVDAKDFGIKTYIRSEKPPDPSTFQRSLSFPEDRPTRTGRKFPGVYMFEDEVNRLSGEGNGDGSEDVSRIRRNTRSYSDDVFVSEPIISGPLLLIPDADDDEDDETASSSAREEYLAGEGLLGDHGEGGVGLEEEADEPEDEGDEDQGEELHRGSVSSYGSGRMVITKTTELVVERDGPSANGDWGL